MLDSSLEQVVRDIFNISVILALAAGCGSASGGAAHTQGEPLEPPSTRPAICETSFADHGAREDTTGELLIQQPPPWVQEETCELRSLPGPARPVRDGPPIYEAAVLADNPQRRLIAAVYWRRDALDWIARELGGTDEHPSWLPEAAGSGLRGRDLVRAIGDIPPDEPHTSMARLIGQDLTENPVRYFDDLTTCVSYSDELWLAAIEIEHGHSPRVVGQYLLADDLYAPFGGGRYWVGDLDGDERDEALVEVRMGENTLCRRDDMPVVRAVLVLDLTTFDIQLHLRTRCIHGFRTRGGRWGSGQVSLFRRDATSGGEADLIEGVNQFSGCLISGGRLNRDFSHRCTNELFGRIWRYDSQADRWNGVWLAPDGEIPSSPCEHLAWRPPGVEPVQVTSIPRDPFPSSDDLPSLEVVVHQAQIEQQSIRSSLYQARSHTEKALQASRYLYATPPEVAASDLEPVPPFQGPFFGSGFPGHVFTAATVEDTDHRRVVAVVHDERLTHIWLFEEIASHPPVPSWFPPESEWEELRNDEDGSSIVSSLESAPLDQVFSDYFGRDTARSRAYSVEQTADYLFGNELFLSLVEVLPGEPPRLANRVELYHEMYGLNEVRFFQADMDGDSTVELLVEANFIGEPRCVLGEPHIRVISIVDLARLEIQLLTRTRCSFGRNYWERAELSLQSDEASLLESITANDADACEAENEDSTEPCAQWERRWRYDREADRWTPPAVDPAPEGWRSICARDFCYYPEEGE